MYHIGRRKQLLCLHDVMPTVSSELRSCVKSRGGRPGLPVPNSPYGLCGQKATLNLFATELRSCLKVEVAVLGAPSLIVRTVSVDVKQH